LLLVFTALRPFFKFDFIFSLSNTFLLRTGLLMVVVGVVMSSWLGLLAFARTLFWIAALGALLLTALFFLRDVGESTGIGVTTFIAPALSLLSFVAAGFVLRGIGDATRYLDDQPENVDEIEKIRSHAIELLDRLHTMEDELTGRFRYDRIVVVGHSLGSVIAYDAVRHAWAKRNRLLPFPPFDDRTCESDTIGCVEMLASAMAPNNDVPPLEGVQAEFLDSQHRLHHLLRDGLPTSAPESRWIVSDLITLGSPLAYADLLLSSGSKDLSRRQSERLLPTCPPRKQKSSAHSSARFWRPAVGSRPASTFLHHAAVFASVRWTNMYFPNDYVGGPVAHHFGDGVVDIALGGKSDWIGFFFWPTYPHSSYWKAPKRKRNRPGHELCVKSLLETIERPPTVLIALPLGEKPPSEDELRALGCSLQRIKDAERARLIAGGEARKPEVDVRLMGYTGKLRRTFWIPGPVRVPVTDDLFREIRRSFSNRASIRFFKSPDLRGGGDDEVVDPDDVDEEKETRSG
jgi:hypothetical protein